MKKTQQVCAGDPSPTLAVHTLNYIQKEEKTEISLHTELS